MQRSTLIVLSALLVTIGILIVLVCLGYRILSISAGSSNAPMPLPSSVFSFTDVLSFFIAILGVMIAVASLIVTAVGVGIAILAVVGYQTFKTEAGAAARDVATAVVEAYLKSPDFDDKLKASVQPSRETQSGDTLPGISTDQPLAAEYPSDGGATR